MLDWLGGSADGLWYWVVVVLLLALAAWETVFPAKAAVRELVVQRWVGNLGVYALNAALLAILTMASPVTIATAWLGEARIMPQPFVWLDHSAGDWVVLVAGVIFLDLQAYVLHRLEHASFLLWRLHSVHHADTDMDVSTTLRHHPGEFILSSTISGTILIVLGMPVWVVPVYALIAIAISLLQHVNARMPERLDRLLGWVVVSPAMHRVHHSVAAEEYNANFGTVLSIWDRLFGTCRRISAGHDVVAFGVEPFTAAHHARPYWALWLPFAITRARPAATVDNCAD